MNYKLLSQSLRLMRQNPFYTLISVVGTAMTIAFVMVVVMIYEFRAADIAPESDRSRLMYTDTGMTQRADDGSNIYSGMGKVAFESLFTGLPGVEEVTYFSALTQSVCSLPASSDRYPCRVRSVAPNWFTFFDYELVAGRTLTQDDSDMARGAFRDSDDDFRSIEAVDNPAFRPMVITERVARQLFGSAAGAVGQVFWCDFNPSTIVGVVRDVSSIFQTAYADAFQPFMLTGEEEDYHYRRTAGLGGNRLGVIRLSSSASADEVRREVERRENQLNAQGLEYKFTLQHLYTHTGYTFFRDGSVDARLVYVLLVLVLLGVPAISISGLMNAQMQSRLGEIAIRKAYGASNLSILTHFFGEGMAGTLLGGAAGYLLSCLLMWLGRVWLFGSGGTVLSGIAIDGSLLFRPGLFVGVLLVCLLFNLMSTLLPVGLALRRSIVVTLKGE